jgi:hypothetical protein
MTANVLSRIAAERGNNLARRALVTRVLAWQVPHALARAS